MYVTALSQSIPFLWFPKASSETALCSSFSFDKPFHKTREGDKCSGQEGHRISALEGNSGCLIYLFPLQNRSSHMSEDTELVCGRPVWEPSTSDQLFPLYPAARPSASLPRKGELHQMSQWTPRQEQGSGESSSPLVSVYSAPE